MERSAMFPDELNVLIGKNISRDFLIGRGYFHVVDDEIVDMELPSLSDFDISESEEDEITCSKVKKYIAEESYVFPSDCWLRCIPAEPEDVEYQEVYVVICIQVKTNDDQLTITDITFYSRFIEQIGGGFFSIPGVSTMESDICQMPIFPPEPFKDVQMLVKGRTIPNGFSLIGKPMPSNKKYFHPNPKYSIAKNSGWRNVYWHLQIDVTKNDIITKVVLDTYEREDSMFCRPVTMSDDYTDAFDCVLFICDQYTDEEWESIIHKI